MSYKSKEIIDGFGDRKLLGEFIITHDFIKDVDEKGMANVWSSDNSPMYRYRKDDPPERVKKLMKDGTPFKLFDDDRNLYYRGRAALTDNDDGFSPLEWAQGYAGCTYIQYYEKTPQGYRWVTL